MTSTDTALEPDTGVRLEQLDRLGEITPPDGDPDRRFVVEACGPAVFLVVDQRATGEFNPAPFTLEHEAEEWADRMEAVHVDGAALTEALFRSGLTLAAAKAAAVRLLADGWHR